MSDQIDSSNFTIKRPLGIIRHLEPTFAVFLTYHTLLSQKQNEREHLKQVFICVPILTVACSQYGH